MDAGINDKIMSNNLVQNLTSGIGHLGLNSLSSLLTNRSATGSNYTPYAGISNFIANINSNGGFYKSNFFEVIFTGMSNGQELTLLCHQAALPGYRLETKSNVIYNLPYETPVGVVYDPLWVTFYLDNNFTAISSLFTDTKSRVDVAGSWSPAYRDTNLLTVSINAITPQAGMQQQSTLQSYSNSNNVFNDITGSQQTFTNVSDNSSNMSSTDGLPVVGQYVLKNAFIKTVQQMPLDWAAQNQISSVTVEILYEWYDISTSTQSQPLLLSGSTPVNFDTVLAQNPLLATTYNATKRTLLNSGALQSSPVANQLSQFLY